MISVPRASFQVARRQVTAMAASTPTNHVLPGALVTPAWLKARLGMKRLVVLDGSWYLPNTGHDAIGDFRRERIPGSRFFDVDSIARPDTDLPHMLPSQQSFAAAADALGITNDSMVVVYDCVGIFSAPRVWWTLRAFGHASVAVLDGGYPRWVSEGLPVCKKEVSTEELQAPVVAVRNPTPSPKFKAVLQDRLVRSLAQIQANLDSKAETLLDARSAGRFMGTEPEPRPGLRGGHIPGSLNLPFPEVLANGGFKSPVELQSKFAEVGVDPARALVASCGTGVTASILALAMHIAHPETQVAVYDGSWTEWAGLPDLPINSA